MTIGMCLVLVYAIGRIILACANDDYRSTKDSRGRDEPGGDM